MQMCEHLMHPMPHPMQVIAANDLAIGGVDRIGQKRKPCRRKF
jgi:hypothetical protein